MTPLDLIHKFLRPLGLVLYALGNAAGYLWGHLVSGVYDGSNTAMQETE